MTTPVIITRAVQTGSGRPSRWDAWGPDGSQYYLRYQNSLGYVLLVRQGEDDWLDNYRRVASFETDEVAGGLIGLEEFAELAGITLNLYGGA